MGRRLIKTPRFHTEGHNASSTPFLRSMGPFVKYAQINLLLMLLIPTRVVRLGHFGFLNPGQGPRRFSNSKVVQEGQRENMSREACHV